MLSTVCVIVVAHTLISSTDPRCYDVLYIVASRGARTERQTPRTADKG